MPLTGQPCEPRSCCAASAWSCVARAALAWLALSGCDGASDSAGNAECATTCCPAATPEQLAATPREDTNLERLALTVSNGVVAEQANYDRIVRDVQAIREAVPAMADIHYFAPLGIQQSGVILLVDQQNFELMLLGAYSAWDCLNEGYRVEAISYEAAPTLRMNMVVVDFKGVLDAAAIAVQYRALPGIEAADANLPGGDGPTICVTPMEGEWHYIFDDASGDCLAGCTEHIFHHFVTQPEGGVDIRGSWSSQSGEPVPAWVEHYASHEACDGP